MIEHFDTTSGITFDTKIQISRLSAWYAEVRALDNVSANIERNRLTALIGASGSGKTTLLRCLNRIISLYRGGRMEGRIIIDDSVITDRTPNIHKLRRRFGMIAQKPNPFPTSIRDNVAYGPRLHRLAQDREHLQSIVRRHLFQVGLWEEVKDDLDRRATTLSVGQQQRVCLARALAYKPEILLLDEPTAALDPANTTRVENLIMSLKRDYTIIMVSHHLDLVSRVSDRAIFLEEGRLIEEGPTETLLSRPTGQTTRRFIDSQAYTAT